MNELFRKAITANEVAKNRPAEGFERNGRAAASTARFVMQAKGYETRCVTGHDGVTRVQARPRRPASQLRWRS